MCGEQRGDSLTGEIAADFSRASRRELVNDSRMFLAETTACDLEWAIVPFEPLITSGSVFYRSKDGQSDKSDVEFDEHDWRVSGEVVKGEFPDG